MVRISSPAMTTLSASKSWRLPDGKMHRMGPCRTTSRLSPTGLYHCPLDSYADPLKVLTSARAASVDVVAVTESPDAFRRFRTRLGRIPGVSVALGLHPASPAASAPGQLQRFFRMLPSAEWIGEVGLDYNSRVGARERRAQYSTFSAVVDHELARTSPMTVHSRGAADDAVAVLAGTGVRQCSTGSQALRNKRRGGSTLGSGSP